MDIFFLQLVLTFVPGIIWERIDNRFGINRPQAQFDILRRSFCFGLSAYTVLFVGAAAINGIGGVVRPDRHRLIDLHMVSFSKDIYTLDNLIFLEIAFASGLSLILSIVWLYVTNNKLPTKIMQFMKATRRFGDEDVWDFTFNSARAEAEYVHVRDFENDLTYSGWVELFSETGSTRELLIRDVVVSTLDGTQLYETPRLYVARAADNVTIEFPYSKQETSDETTNVDGPDRNQRLWTRPAAHRGLSR